MSSTSSINHIPGNYIPPPNRNSQLLNFLDNVDRLLNLMRSQFPQLQSSGLYSLNEIIGQKFKYMSTVFSKYRSMTPLINLLKSKERKTTEIVMSILWNFSAEENLKIKIFDEGIFDVLLEALEQREYVDQFLSSSAIIQNLSEYKFESGKVNPNQLKIVRNKRLMKLIGERTKCRDHKIKFLSCLTICNLSMHEENRQILRDLGYFECVDQFLEDSLSTTQFPASFNWVTLQPHIPLLESKDLEVQKFVLYCVKSFVQDEKYKRERLWKAMGENNGCSRLLELSKSKDEIVSNMSKDICENIKIGESSIIYEDEHTEIKSQLKPLYNNKAYYPDFILKFKEKEIYLHKSICLSRCNKLVDWLKKEKVKKIKLDDSRWIDSVTLDDEQVYDIMAELCRWMYGLDPRITRGNSFMMLQYSHMLELHEIQQRCEFYLWHYIDTDNAGELLELAMRTQSKQLEKVTLEYILRNISSIYNGNLYHYPLSPSPTTSMSNLSINSPKSTDNNNNNDNNNDKPSSSNNNNNNDKIKSKELWKGKWDEDVKLYVARKYQDLYLKHLKEIEKLNHDVLNSNPF